MVRGKCIFASLSDLIETIDEIKKFVDQDTLGRYRIVELENRFKQGSNNSPPISDVTLKIALKDVIVAQLQLTLQTNKAAY